MIKELWKQVVEIQLRAKKRKVSINSMVLWRESNRMGSHFLCFSYFTHYQQFQKQCGNQSLLLNLSLKGWRSWKSWSIVTVLFSPYLLKEESLQAPNFDGLPWNYLLKNVGFSKNRSTNHLKRKWLVEKHTWESCTERDCICSGILLAFTAIC